MTEVIIVVGPPGSGKTTYVQKNRGRGDLVVDVDALFVALSLQDERTSGKELMPFVLAARDAVLARLLEPSDVSRAWIITTSTDRKLIERLRLQYSATILLMEVSPGECKRRIMADPRRKNHPQWFELVDRWWDGWNHPNRYRQERFE